MKAFLIITGLFCIAMLMVFAAPPSDPYGFSILANAAYLIVIYLFALLSYGTFRRVKRLANSAKDPMPGHLQGMVARSQLPDWAAAPKNEYRKP